MDDPHRPERLAAWRDRMRANPATRPWYRAAVAVCGGLMVLAAALTGWLPGPGGIPLFLAGLALWSTEFAWAHRLMVLAKGWLDRWLALSAPRRWSVVAAALLAALLTWWGMAAWHGVPAWVPETVAAHVDRLPLVER